MGGTGITWENPQLLAFTHPQIGFPGSCWWAELVCIQALVKLCEKLNIANSSLATNLTKKRVTFK